MDTIEKFGETIEKLGVFIRFVCKHIEQFSGKKNGIQHKEIFTQAAKEPNLIKLRQGGKRIPIVLRKNNIPRGQDFYGAAKSGFVAFASLGNGGDFAIISRQKGYDLRGFRVVD